jgi:glutathione peroxidase
MRTTLALSLLLLVACTAESGPAAPAEQAPQASGESDKPKAPDLVPPDPDDEPPTAASCTGDMGTLYELNVKKLAQIDALQLCSLKGYVMLIVNGASGCGYTPQYAPLEALYEKYKDQKFMVLAFPSKSFNQEKDTDEEVSQFCTTKYHITFPLFTIGPVVDNAQKNEVAQPVYQWLKKQPGMEKPVPWNFEKFLIARDGKAVKRFAYTMNPDPAKDPTIENAIKAELAKP